MSDLSMEAQRVSTPPQSAVQRARRGLELSGTLPIALVACAAFALYWASSFILQARQATTHFGADSWYFAELAQGNVFAQVHGNYFLDRVARFHPTTVVLAAGWMQILSPLTPWIAPLHLLKAMFAAVGALGVWAATSAFLAILPRAQAVLFGIIYAVSFGVWYFSSIEESKIVTASLSALYIAGYLHLRSKWTLRGAVLLTIILLVACLNEMVSGFLVVIPVVDTLMRHGWDLREGRWIALHALAGPVAFVVIEGFLYGHLVGLTHPEGTSHFSLLISYVSQNTYNFAQLYSFVIYWLFFNIAAPTRDAMYGVAEGVNYKGFVYKGYFEPSLTNYFLSPASVGVAAFSCGLLAAAGARYRSFRISNDAVALLLGLVAYTLLRGVFFFIFNPREPLLFSPAVTLAHMLVVAMVIAASKLPARHMTAGVFAALLFVANGAFIIGR